MERIKQYQKMVDGLVKKHYNKFRNTYMLCAMDEEDIKQEIYLELIKVLAKHEKTNKTFIWKTIEFRLGEIRTIVLRKITLAERGDKTEKPTFVELDRVYENNEAFMVDPAEIPLFDQLKHILPEEDYKLIEMKYVDELGFEEISKKTGISRGGLVYRYEEIYKKIKGKADFF